MKRFEVFVKPSALKDLKAIEPSYQELIKVKLRALANEPLPPGIKKLSGPEGLYRLRQGVFRIVYSVDYQAGVVRVLAIQHRREVYRHLD